jgi:membrane fusion protein
MTMDQPRVVQTGLQAADSSPVANVPLFRPQVLAQRQAQWMGPVLVKPRPSHRWFTVFALAVTAAIVSLFYFGTYARKAQLSGLLVPEQGLVRVFAPQASVATQFFVKEGDVVRKGQPLITLSTEIKSASLGDTQANILKTLSSRRESLLKEEQESRQLLRQQTTALSGRLAALRLEQEQLAEEIALQESRLKLAVRTEERQRDLAAQGFLPAQQAQAATEARLEQAARMRILQRNSMALKRDRLTLEGELRDLPLKSAARSADIQRSIAEIRQQSAEVEARREIVIPAPQSGTVTAIQSETGGQASATVPLLSIVPSDAELEAHLFASSRAMGFLKSGQQVLLRYSAYPYQKFGHYAGVVRSISRTALSPAELPAQLAGLTSLFGPSEPVYRITVALERQTVTAYGNAVLLQPGMQLEAAVVIEERRLYEWILDPLYTLTGKWNP